MEKQYGVVLEAGYAATLESLLSKYRVAPRRGCEHLFMIYARSVTPGFPFCSVEVALENGDSWLLSIPTSALLLVAEMAGSGSGNDTPQEPQKRRIGFFSD